MEETVPAPTGPAPTVPLLTRRHHVDLVRTASAICPADLAG
jgi:hypothetical protein